MTDFKNTFSNFFNSKVFQANKGLFTAAFLTMIYILYYKISKTLLNPLPFLLIYILYRIRLDNILQKYFPRPELKTTLWLILGSLVIFSIFNSTLSVARIMDFYYGTDQERLIWDITDPYSNHYRIRAHPFYVLLWQSLFHLFAPLNHTKASVESYICVIAALNVGLFYLWLTRINASRIANLFATALFIISFPQLLNAGIIVESFIFTQTTSLLCFIYFSFVFKNNQLKFYQLLGVALLTFSSLITNLAIFAIGLLLLLNQQYQTQQLTLKKAVIFLAKLILCFLIAASVLLLLQKFIYEGGAPSNLITLLTQLLAEDTTYSSIPTSTGFISYVLNFFSSLWGMESYLDQTSPFIALWLLMLLPLLALKKTALCNSNFLFILGTLLFMFTLHSFYGRNELNIYTSNFNYLFCALFAIAAGLVAKRWQKIYFALFAIMLINMVLVNFITLKEQKITDNFIFRGQSEKSWFSFDNTDKELLSLKLKMLQAHKDKVITLHVLDHRKLNTNTEPFYYLGMENRRKLFFEKDALYDFKTKEKLFDFGRVKKVIILPHLYKAEITLKDKTKYQLYEDKYGVFIQKGDEKPQMVEGTGIKIDLPDFAEYQYPELMKILYQELMFSVIDGKPFARLYDYPENKLWYRDAALTGMFLNQFNKVYLIENWIRHLDKVYDYNHKGLYLNMSDGEPDNLGQLLYLNGLIKKPNQQIIQEIITEAQNISKDSCLTGTTDFQQQSQYQTQWLKLGLKQLGREDVNAQFKEDCPDNSYKNLLWFLAPEPNPASFKPLRDSRLVTIYKIGQSFSKSKKKDSKHADFDKQPYPYIQTAMSHHQMRTGQPYNPPLLTSILYPLTWGDNTRPHSWHDFELFYYLSEFKK